MLKIQINLKRAGKTIVKTAVILFLAGMISAPFLTGAPKDPHNPLSHKQSTQFDAVITKVFSSESFSTDQSYSPDDIVANIKNFVDTPKNGTPWHIFAQTKEHEYLYTDEQGEEWSGLRPEFSDDLKTLDGQDILVQGYMFPLSQDEDQPLFLLGPFPISCPYHYHVTPNLIIEVHAGTGVPFSYDPINIKGQLELVPKDDEYNVFYRLKNAEIVKQSEK